MKSIKDINFKGRKVLLRVDFNVPVDDNKHITDDTRMVESLPTIKKLQKAINLKYDQKILVNKTQFYSDKTGGIIEMIVIKQAIWDTDKQKIINVELFKSPSDVQIVLYLRDLWYKLNGWEVPTDNEYWEDVKRKKGIRT